MKRFDKAIIERMQEKLGLTEEEAKEWLNMIRKIAADEYDKQMNVPF